MAAARYLWRQLNQKQREELLAWRKERDYPWHSPQHRPNFGHLRFLISAACYEHRHYIGYSWSAWTVSPVTCSQCSQRMRVRPSRGACCRITTTRSWRRRRLNSYCMNWDCFMAALRTPGMVRSELADGKYS